MANKAVLRMLKENYEKGCNGYLVELLNRWGMDGVNGYWVADEVGGTFAYGDYLFISMEDIIYCVENDVTENEYVEHQDYNVEANEFGFDIINIRAWHNGCPRVSRETFDKFRKMKADLNAEIEKEKESIKEKKGNNPF